MFGSRSVAYYSRNWVRMLHIFIFNKSNMREARSTHSKGGDKLVRRGGGTSICQDGNYFYRSSPQATGLFKEFATFYNKAFTIKLQTL